METSLRDLIQPLKNKLWELKRSLTSPGLTASQYEQTVAHIEVVTRALRHTAELEKDCAALSSVKKAA